MSNSPHTTTGAITVNGVDYWIHEGDQQTTISNEDGWRLLPSDKDKTTARAVLTKARAQNLLSQERVDAIRHELALD